MLLTPFLSSVMPTMGNSTWIVMVITKHLNRWKKKEWKGRKKEAEGEQD